MGDDRPDLGPAAGRQRRRVPVQVALVGLEGVRGQPALYREVIEVPADGGRDRGQLRTSASGRTGRPCASATGGQVISPSKVFRPRASGCLVT